MPPVFGLTLAAVAACGSLVLVQLLAFEADPVALVVLVGAERGGHHGHAAAWADRRTVVVIHAVSIPLFVGSVVTRRWRLPASHHLA